VKVPLSLLLGFCDPGLEPEGLADVLALSGTEVERVSRIGVEDPTGFVVGHVLEAVPHPDADRLRVCSVDVGSGEPATIVCGAPNVAAGQAVPVALPGAVMPGGTKIRKAKLRGVESSGMICSEQELGLGREADGIMVLPEGVGPPGSPLGESVTLGEVVLELEITPNRPDCLGVYGVARELHAATGAPLAPPPWVEDLGSDGELEGVGLTVEAEDLCPAFTARVYRLPGGGVTPTEIAGHLVAAGMRPISPVVDITNYVMLVVGEPLHAFDLDRIEGSALVVRAATEGESVTTLDGEERNLSAGDAVICDGSGPVSIAGVMGGARAEVTEATESVLLEAAVWDGPAIHSASTRLGLRSEASARFEKGLSPDLAWRGQAYASVLFKRIFGVVPERGTAVAGARSEARTITLETSAVNSLLGTELTAERIVGPLGRLGMEPKVEGGTVTVEVAADRLDLERPVDLIEEVARIDGLDRIPDRIPTSRSGGGGLTRPQRLRRRIEDHMADLGCFGIAGWSFASPSLGDRLLLPDADPRREAVRLLNPMSGEESELRTTLLGTLLDAVGRNCARGIATVRLFELGAVYSPGSDGLADEPLKLGCVMHGPASPPWWGDPAPEPVSVHAGIGLIGALLDRLHCDWQATRQSEVEPFLHPGRAADISIAGRNAGWVGELHPAVVGGWGMQGGVAFELDVATVIEGVADVVHYSPVSAFPAVSQDLAVVVSSGTPAAELVAIARDAGGSELEHVEVFDVYEGEGIGAGQVSIALRLRFRAPDRTMTEDEATGLRGAILAALEERKGARARG